MGIDKPYVLSYHLNMKPFDWDQNKNNLIKATREVSFEDARMAFLNNKVLDDFPNPNQKKYPRQRMSILEIDDYAYLVPYVENENVIFLKTIIPNGKATRKYLRKENYGS